MPQPQRTTLAGTGEVRFVGENERARLCGELAASGFLVVEVPALGGFAGALADRLDDAIERALAGRGGPGRGLAAPGDRDATLGDQLYRARRVGAAGLAAVFSGLHDAAREQGALAPADTALIRFLAEATQERPLVLVLDERDGEAPAYGDPIALGKILRPMAAMPTGLVLATLPEPIALPVTPSPAPAQTPTRITALAPPLAERATTLASHVAGAVQVSIEEPWRSWTLQLAAARGPLPLAELEHLFAESYMPLGDAIARGVDDPRARQAYDDFRGAFAKSYTETFPTLAATTKRPRMVLDVHEVAARLTRLHGARSTRLLLVDAMRWDLSRMVQDRVRTRMGSRAVLTEELVLWSALPSTTLRQLETIARGLEALRSPGELDSEGQPLRGRTADYVRRLRVGPRELHKLDLVEARLQSARGAVLRSLPEIADATAEVIARHAESLPARTLLLVFGDHGFTVDRTGAMRQGGASPEEVLVGAFAMLVGEVH